MGCVELSRNICEGVRDALNEPGESHAAKPYPERIDKEGLTAITEFPHQAYSGMA